MRGYRTSIRLPKSSKFRGLLFNVARSRLAIPEGWNRVGETSSSAAAVRVAAGTGATRAIDLAYAAMDTAAHRGLALLRRIPLWLRLGAIALLGAAAAGVVAYE